MKERPILFNAPMVQAIMEGRKTMTRRVISPQPKLSERVGFMWKGRAYGIGFNHDDTIRNFARPCCSYGGPGDRLWVRETWGKVCDGSIVYRADYPGKKPYLSPSVGGPWKPSIHMFRKYSRITLEITSIKVERLQSIGQVAACKEGCPDFVEPLEWFQNLWDSINGKKYPWSSNPWAWVIEFKRIEETGE
jgi:hypothetical protein